MEDLEYSKATATDAILLADSRIDFLTELCGEQLPETTALLRANLEQYFKDAVVTGSYVGILARSEGQLVGTGGMTFREQPGSFRNPSGRTAYIMNMYTIQGFRRKGISTHILKALMDTAMAMGIQSFELHATRDGEPVYQRCGFEQHHEPTYRKHNFETV